MMRPEPECPERTELADLLDGRLPPDILEGVAAHVESCERCGQVLGEMEKSSTRHRVRDVRSSTPLEKTVLPLLTGMLEPCAVPGALGKLGVFVVMEVLDRGGMGIVLRGEDPSLKREVAIKLLSPDLAAAEESRGRFLREAQTAAAIDHENVIPIFAVSEDSLLPWLVMPFNNGGSLQQRLDREGRLPWPEAVRIGEAVAAGLAAAHAQGVLHRDIKPANILLSQEGKVRIADFGLARAADASLLTRSGVLSGTPAYMAPEQIDGAEADARADLFSLGVLLYRMVSERGPFDAPNATATIKKVAFDEAPPLRRQPDPPPEWYCQLVHSLLEKKPENRPADAAAVVAALRMKSVRKPGAIAAKVRTAAAVLTVLGLAGALAFVLTRPRDFSAGGENPSPEADLRSAAERMRAGKPADRIAFLVNAVRQGGETRQTASRALLYDLAWTAEPTPFAAGGPALPLELDVGMELREVAYGSDGGDVFGISPDGRYSVWGARGGRLLIGRFYWPARAEVLATGSKLTAFYANKGEVYFLNHNTFFLQAVRLDQTGLLRCGALSPDDSLTLTGREDGTVALWENSTGAKTAEWTHPGVGAVTRVLFSRDGRTGISASEDGTVLVLDVLSRKMRGAPLPHGGPVHWVEISPDMSRVASGAADNTARIWNLADATPLTPPLPHGGESGPEGIFGVFVTNERLATGGGGDGQVILRDARTGEPAAEPLAHAARVTALTSSGGVLATGSEDGRVRLWDGMRGEPLSPEIQIGGPVNRIRFSPIAAQMLVAGSRSASLYDLVPPEFDLPDWFLDLAENLSGRQINERGVLVDIPKRSAAELAADIPESAGPSDAMVVRFARWLLAAPENRPVPPFSEAVPPEKDGLREQIIRVMLDQLERSEPEVPAGE